MVQQADSGKPAAQAFIREFFDQNPLSHLGLIVLRNGVAEKLTDLSGSPVRKAKQRLLL